MEPALGVDGLGEPMSTLVGPGLLRDIEDFLTSADE